MTAMIHPPPIVAPTSALEAARLTRGGSVSGRHPDGFGGARDASILAAGDYYGCHGVAVIQATARTKPLLRRAGLSRIKTHAFYEVAVIRDGFGRLQLATREDYQS